MFIHRLQSGRIQIMNSAIKLHKLTKYYARGKILGVKNLSLEVESGEIFGFIGPNGAGKSTTIRLILDLIRPTSGQIEVFGMDSHKQSTSIKKMLGFLPGEIFLPENMSGEECLNFYAGFKSEIDRKYLQSLIERFELNLAKKVGDYSKGNKQKLAIILAMMHKPRLLILDEPTSGLDPLNQQEFYNLIKETKKWGATVFFSTHILEEAQKLCDRVGIIKSGKLLTIENIDQFKEKNIRDIHLETGETIPLAKLEFPGIQKIERTTYGYHLVTIGKNSKIIQHLAKLPFDDITINQPSLDELFMRYYK